MGRGRKGAMRVGDEKDRREWELRDECRDGSQELLGSHEELDLFLIHVTVVTNARKEIKNIVLGILAFKIYRATLGFAEDF